MQEWQFDGLVGPTHNYAGLAYGNVASAKNAGAVSNPKQAALQGLEKMRFVRGLGMRQAFLPPHYRPMISSLQQIGFAGGIDSVLGQAYRTAPAMLASVFSSAFMWTANAGTITPATDAADGRLHITPANLLSNYHRSLEGESATWHLRHIFADPTHFMVHDPLPATSRFSDEGAANHMRVCGSGHAHAGVHVYVYGAGGDAPMPTRNFPARQQREAFEAVARAHGVKADCSIFVQQSPEAIDAGVFHNDVIAMNTTRLMVAHEKAFVPGAGVAEQVARRMGGIDFVYEEIAESELPLVDAVKSYFFNSQVLELPDGRIVIVAPGEAQKNDAARRTLERLSSSNGPVAAVYYLDVRESMRNGGGPACLRLRVALNGEQAAAMHQGIVFTDEKHAQLTDWVQRHYRDRLALEDLRDPAFVTELNVAYEALERLIGLPGIYTRFMG